MSFSNPITHQDYPDPDVIRVGDTYYMISTTMHFMPGGVILRSYDLQHWEIATYVFDTLDHTPAQQLQGDKNIYGNGMWAATIRYHKGLFYVLFVANDTHKTYLYRSSSMEGPWDKSEVEGFYHDASLFFEKNHVYIVYGNTDIWMTELTSDLSGPKKGGFHRLLVSESDNPHRGLGYEGSHFYKINGYYYLFLIHCEKGKWFRTEACFFSSSLDADFTGGDVFAEDIHFRNSGVAQGGIVDTPEGNWYAIMFQDHGAVGRIPVVAPVTLKDGLVEIGENGSMPAQFDIRSTRPDYIYEPLFVSGFIGKDKLLHSAWQWNHEPNHAGWRLDAKKNSLVLTTTKLSKNITEAVNTLTQRTKEPYSCATVTLDISKLNDGDCTGLSAFQGCYGWIGITKENGILYLVMRGKRPDKGQGISWENPYMEEEFVRITLPQQESITLRCETYYTETEDYAVFSYKKEKCFIPLDITHPLVFLLDHFCGCRFGLFYFSTKSMGGSVAFSNFEYQ